MRVSTDLSDALLRTIILLEMALHVAYCAKPPIVSKKSKLCGDEQCEEVLFKAKVKRVMGSNHEAFLSLTEGAVIDVTAVKFSDRTDLMEGKLSDGRRGNFYVGAIDIGPYVEFLRNAIATRKEMKEISQDRVDVGLKKVLGFVRADLYLVRDYNVQAQTYAMEQNVPEPELLPVPEVLTNSHLGHTHAHGHSHEASNHGHLHSNDASSTDHGHKYDSSSQDQGHNYGGHFHENTLISHVHKTDIEMDADQESRGGHINYELPQVSLEDKTRQTSLGSVSGKNTEQGETVHVKEATLQETSLQKETISVASDQEKHFVIPDLPAVAPAPATASVEIKESDVTLTSSLSENMNRKDSIVSTTIQTAPTSRLDIIASRVIREENPPQHVDLTSPLPSSNTAPVLQSVVKEAVPLSANPIADDATPIAMLSPTASEATTSSAEAILDAPPNESTVQESSAHSSLLQNFTSGEEITPTLDELPLANFLAKEPERLDAKATAVSKEVLADAPTFSTSVETEYCSREECPSANGVSSTELNGQGTSESQGEVKLAEHRVPSEVTNTAQPLLVEHSSVCDGPVGGLMKSLSGSIETIVSSSWFDSPGIGLVLNIAFLLVFVVIHFTSCFLSDFTESKLFDRMLVHDLATNCKFLVEQTRVKEVELNRVRSAGSQLEGENNSKNELQDEICQKNVEIQELSRNGECLKAVVDQLERSLQSTKAELATERSCRDEASRRAEEYKHRLEDSERVYSNVTNELSSVQKMRKLLEESLDVERRSHVAVATNLKEAKEDLRKLRVELDSLSTESGKLKLEKSNLELENAALSAMIEEMDKNRKENSAGESGGSGGWSDFGDDFGEVEEDKEKTPASSTVTIPVAIVGSDVREAAKLRAQLKKLEQEVETVRAALMYEKDQRQHFESKVEALENEVEKKTKEVEDRERERSRADERCNELLSIMKDNTLVIREAELLRDKLQENLSKQQAELGSLIQEKRTKEDRIQELEVELKRVRNEHLKLETKRFNEVLDLKHRLDAMQANRQLISPTTGYDLLNQSVSSSDRETILPPALLWEEAPRAVSSATSPEDDFLLETSPLSKRGSMRGRNRVICDQSSFEKEKRREKKESSHRRVRSRSHGRQLWSSGVLDHPQLGPEPSGSSQDRRHSRSSRIHYSSGGSNEGRSPPPEIPLLSAVPPPGVKKPMGKRVTDADFDIKSS